MANTASANKVALASTNDKLKHWTQAIRDLYAEFLDLKEGVVPQWHASPTTQYGPGDSFRYGHLRLLDSLLLEFAQNEDGTWWTKSNLDVNDEYRWNAVTWYSGLFVAVGSHGRIVTSRDGKFWDNVHWMIADEELSSSNIDNIDLYDVKWCGNMFVAVGSRNSFVYSYDGSYWHKPMYVGKCYNGTVLVSSDNEDLTKCPKKFTANDAWKGVAYDSKTGIIMLCGTQCRTLTCHYMSGTSTVSAIVFGETVFHRDSSDRDHWILNSIESKQDPDSLSTTFCACGNWNSVVWCRADWRSLRIVWPDDGSGNAVYAPLQIEDSEHSISGGTITEYTGWNNISVQDDPEGNKVFVIIGSSGMAMISLTGIGYAWNASSYPSESSSINTEFQCQAKGMNLAVIAGDWLSTASPNITMYNDSTYVDPEDVEFGAPIKTVQYFSTIVDSASWYGAAYGEKVFVLVGGSNRIYYHECSEQDYSGAALSVKFYKNLVAVLEERIKELEDQFLIDNMTFISLINETKTFNWNDPHVQMFRTEGNVTLNFNTAPLSIYRETLIYLEANKNTVLSLSGSAEWENDLYEPEWGKKGSHLLIKAVYIGNRVILQIIDNDQLADNLVDLLNG